jgi:hypothetical protein
MLRMTVQWAEYGTIKWEQWWVSQHGPNLGRKATPEEHVSFANFDLSHVGLPKLVPAADGSYLLPLVPGDKQDLATEILRKHGFVVTKSESF